MFYKKVSIPEYGTCNALKATLNVKKIRKKLYNIKWWFIRQTHLGVGSSEN